MTSCIVALFLAASAPAAVPADANVHAVEATGDVVVHIVVDKQHSVSLVGSATLTLAGDVLVVAAPARAEGAPPVVTVTADAISRVRAAGAARVDVVGLAGKACSLEASGTASLRVSGKTVAALTLTASGTARIDTAGLTAGAIDATLGDAARATVHVADRGTLTCTLAKASRLVVKGKPKDIRKTVTGVARLDLE